MHVDFQQRIQLISRDLHLDQQELNAELSQLLPGTPLSAALFPFTGVPPGLIPVSPFALSAVEESDEEQECPGGVLVVGGRRIFFYELTRADKQSALKGKKRRLEKRKASTTESEVDKAKEKEKERESRKVKPRCFVIWPWSEIVAYVSDCSSSLIIPVFILYDLDGILLTLTAEGFSLVISSVVSACSF